jgi:predicted dehydrogenase
VEHRVVLKAACGRNADKVKVFAAQGGWERAETDWRRLVEAPDIDAIDICTPNDMHQQIAIAAAANGKMVLCEKPLARSVAEAEPMVAAIEKAGVPNMVWFNYRRVPAIALAKQLIDEGRIGRVLQIQEYALNTTGLVGLPKWQSDPANLGTLFGHAIHNFDRIRWLTGQEIRTVYAKCGSLEPDVKVEGTSMVLMTLADGASAACGPRSRSLPSFPRSQFSAWIVGEKGIMDLDAYGELCVAVDGKWESWRRRPDRLGRQGLPWTRSPGVVYAAMPGFHRRVSDGRPPMVTGWDGRQAVAAALAAYERRRGRPRDHAVSLNSSGHRWTG